MAQQTVARGGRRVSARSGLALLASTVVVALLALLWPSASVAAPKPPADFNGDGKTDFGVYRPSTGAWYAAFAGGGYTQAAWGASGDVPAPGDYNGDAKTDFAVFRPSTGVWYVAYAGGGSIKATWGATGDVPVPGDYNGDGKTDFAVYRPSTGKWYVYYSGGGSIAGTWGDSTDVPVPGDYNGDGKADFAVYRPSTGKWYVFYSGGGSIAGTWGDSGDVPVPGDYNGDGKADLAVYRPSNGSWYAYFSGGGSMKATLGAAGDSPVPGDYDGDGTTDPAVFRPSTSEWYVMGGIAATWGVSGDVPLSGAIFASVNDAPALPGIETGALLYTENDPATAITSTIRATDVDSANFTGATVSITSNYANGQDVLSFADQLGITGNFNAATGTLTLSGSASTADYQTALRAVQYTNTSVSPSTAARVVSFQAGDGAAANNLSNVATRTITVVAVNSAPTITLSGSTPSFTEDGAPVSVDSGLTVADIDDTDLVSGSVTITAGTVAGDSLTFTPGASGITDTDAAADVLALSGTATVAEWQAVLQSVQFSTTSQAPGTSRTIRFVVNDGDTDSNLADKTVTVVAVNDAPTVNLDAATPLAYNENAGLINLFGPAATVDDVDSETLDSLAVTISSGFDATFDTLDLNTAGFVTDFTGGVLTITKAGGTLAEYTTALRNVRFANSDDDPDDRKDGTPNPSAAARTFSVVADDGTDTGTPATRDLTITPVNDPPSAPSTAPTAAGVRNTTLVSGTNSVTGPKAARTLDLEGDSVDPDGPDSSIAVVPVTAAATTQGGRITLDASGNLTYEPPANATLATDTYSYQLTDGTSTTPVTFTVNFSGAVWYVADGAALPRDGTAARPFDTVAGALGVASANHAIHVRGTTGDGVLTGGVTLQSGQKLIGEGVALTNTDVGSATAETLFAAGTRPQLTSSNVDVVTVAANAQIAGLVLNPDGTANGVFGNNVAGVTLRDMSVNDTGTFATQPAIELTGTGNGLAFLGTVSLATTQAGALSVTGTALSGTVAGVTVAGSTNSAGVSLTNTTGSLTFTTLAITTTNQTGFLLNNADSIDVLAGTVASTNRPAVDAIGLDSGSDLTFTDIDSTNSTSDGVNLDGTGNWTFSAASGSTISGAATVGFDVNGGSGTVSYAGSIANSATGEAADVTGRSGDTTISGNITGTGGTGVNVSGNTGGTTTFSGTTKTLSTGANAAVTLNNSGSHAVVFSNGGLDIDTTSGAGFSATGGASLVVTGSPNTIDSTTTGTALNVVTTTIGVGGLQFRSISAGSTAPGPANGIVLNNTGTAAGLTVSGTGADGTGGTIARTTGDAVSLTSTKFTSLSNMIIGDSTATAGQTPDATNHIGGDGIDMNNADDVTLNNMRIARTGNHGIDGTGVTNLSLTNSEIYNAGDANGDSAFAFNDFGANQTNLEGTVTVTNTVFDGMVENGIDIENFGGTLNMTVSGSRFANNTSTLCSGGTCGENGLLARADGTSVIHLTVNNNGATKTLFDGIDGNGLFFISEGSSATASTLNVTQTTIQNSKAIGLVIFGGTGDHTSTIQSRLNFTVGGAAGSGVSITGSNATAVSIQPNGKSIVRGTFSHVTVTGSTLGRGIEVLSDDVSTAVIDINNNTISNTAFNGIFANNGDKGVLDIHIRNNSVSAPTDALSGLANHGVEVNPVPRAVADPVDFATTTCLDIAGNSSAGGPNGGAGYRLRQRAVDVVFRLERLTGSVTDPVNIVNFVVAQNTSGTGSATVSNGYTAVADGACADV